MVKILKLNGVFICRSTLQHLSDEELNCSIHKDMGRNFDESIGHHLGPAALPQDFPAEELTPDPTYYDDTNAMDPEYGEAEVMPKIGYNYLSAELMLPKGSVMVKGHMTAQKRDRDGNPVEHANDNPILDTISYIVDFDDGDPTKLTANMIAGSLYSQCDSGGNQYVLLEEIVNHQHLPTPIKLSDQKINCADGKSYLKHLTVGWQLCCQWKDSSTSWENLADRGSCPEFAKISNLLYDPEKCSDMINLLT